RHFLRFHAARSAVDASGGDVRRLPLFFWTGRPGLRSRRGDLALNKGGRSLALCFAGGGHRRRLSRAEPVCPPPRRPAPHWAPGRHPPRCVSTGAEKEWPIPDRLVLPDEDLAGWGDLVVGWPVRLAVRAGAAQGSVLGGMHGRVPRRSLG